jgi:hypothetical protein
MEEQTKKVNCHEIGILSVDCDSEDVEKWSTVGTLVNVAFDKPAFQSFDLHNENMASIAVDGDTNKKNDANASQFRVEKMVTRN